MSDVGYVDTHCHLDHHWEASVDEQVARARAAGVHRLVTIGTDLVSSRQAVDAAFSHDGVWAVVGIHPNDADEATGSVLAEIEELAADPRVVGVGETGLDRYRDATTPEQQDEAFRAHIEIAKRTGRTLVIHCRDAWEPCLETLEDQGAPDRVVMHCFSGDAGIVARCAEHGWFMSFAGNVTFTNAGPLRAAAASVPAELLLTETDSPFLTPHPHRGTPNEPRHVPLVIEALAAVHERSPDWMREQVWENSGRAFAFAEAGVN
ncbi:MAG: TatD family hydrolase [Nitriliruptorales bacterium]|nr:TatD family hydrolase [Nitriliruptorales bacterium]